MNLRSNKELCNEIGISFNQVLDQPLYRHLYWSFDHDRLAFGFGDLDQNDLNKIYAYVSKEGKRSMIFTAWEEGEEFPVLRISYAAGLTRPYTAMKMSRYNLIELQDHAS